MHPGSAPEPSSPSATGPTLVAPRSPDEPDLPLSPGQTLSGRYVVERALAEGGMGVVYLGRHIELEQPVAIKFLRRALTQNPVLVERFLNEARAAAALRSPHVVRVMDVGQLETGQPYLVMERLVGIDLDALVTRSGPLSVDDAVRYALQACDALAEAHAAGIVHRDIKPENLFLSRQGTREGIVKVVDFGLAKRLDGSRTKVVTGPQDSMGSPCYMSPEQIASARSVDCRTDIWAMGAVLYHLLSGGPPFDGDTLKEVCSRVLNDAPRPLSELRPSVPRALDVIVQQCLQKNPARRYASIAALAADLEHLLRTRSRRLPSASERPRRLWGWLLGLIGITAAGFVASDLRALLRATRSFEEPPVLGETASVPVSREWPVVLPRPASGPQAEAERTVDAPAPPEPAPTVHERRPARRSRTEPVSSAEAPAEPVLTPEEIARRRAEYQDYLRRQGLTPLRDVLERMQRPERGSGASSGATP